MQIIKDFTFFVVQQVCLAAWTDLLQAVEKVWHGQCGHFQ